MAPDMGHMAQNSVSCSVHVSKPVDTLLNTLWCTDDQRSTDCDTGVHNRVSSDKGVACAMFYEYVLRPQADLHADIQSKMNDSCGRSMMT